MKSEIKLTLEGVELPSVIHEYRVALLENGRVIKISFIHYKGSGGRVEMIRCEPYYTWQQNNSRRSSIKYLIYQFINELKNELL